MANSPEFPYREPLVDPETGLVSGRILVWLRDLSGTVNANVGVVNIEALSNQNATIGATPLPTDALEPGMYRVSWYQQVTTTAGVSSDLTTSLGWISDGAVQSYTGATMNGNTLSTSQSDSRVVDIDQATPISYSTVYNSNPAGAMHFKLIVTLESLGSQ